MDAREFILLARTDTSLADRPIFTKLPWLLSRSLPEFTPHIKLNKLQSPLFHETALQQAVIEFHSRAGTLTPEISRRIPVLKAGNIVRLSHQPNLFAYSKLIGQFLALELLSKSTSLAPLYYFIDYDTVNDTRFSRSYLPDPTAPDGRRHLQLPRSSRSHRTALINKIAKPSKEWLQSTIVSIQTVANMYSRFKLADDLIELRLSRLLHDLEFAWQNGRNVAEMSAILLSRFINLWLNLPIPFVPGSFLWSQIATASLQTEFSNFVQLSEALHRAHKELLQYGIKLVSTEKEALWLPWWLICSCGSRVGLYLTGDRSAYGICPHCKTEYRFDLKDQYWQTCSTQTAPKIILHNLLNIVGFGYQAGVNHIGSAEHILTHSLAMTYLSRHPMPQWLWECNGPFGTFLEDESLPLHTPFQREAALVARSGNASFVYFALCMRPETLRDKIELKILGKLP